MYMVAKNCVFILHRSSFKNAVASLFDACPSVSSQQLFPGESLSDEDMTPAGAGMGALVSAVAIVFLCH